MQPRRNVSLHRTATCVFSAVLLLLCLTCTATATPCISHVFIIVLENKSFDETFGPSSPAPYLANTLTAEGQLLRQYYAIGHSSLDNYIALVSGQGPNLFTQSDCQLYAEFLPGLA